ncbi:MAG: ATP-binding protein [Bacilli bacterium]
MANSEKEFLKGSVNPSNLFKSLKYKSDFRRANPDYFDPEGLLVFCGPQGSGKTLSAVQYVKKILEKYPKAILVSNITINDLPKDIQVYEYEGIESLKKYENGYNGVIYLIDEIHLEWNSLESKNISIEEMIEFSQQRKQRKHIVGTSQVYGRLAKPLREQIKNVVLCKNYFGLIQFNDLIDGFNTIEKDGTLETDSIKRYFWFHSPLLYKCYDTYAKMNRYKKEWNGHSRVNTLGG